VESAVEPAEMYSTTRTRTIVQLPGVNKRNGLVRTW